MFFAFTPLVTAQQAALNIVTQVRQGSGVEAPDTLVVLMRSTSANSLNLGAVNFSFVYRHSCATYVSLSSLFRQQWTTFLEQTQVAQTVSRTYNGTAYTRRLSYGNAYPIGFAGATPVTVPGSANPYMEVMRLVFSGVCAEDIYMEDENQNPINQLAGVNFESVSYNIERVGGLPVTLTHFDATALEFGSVQLSWSTAQEYNNDYFEVQKSLTEEFDAFDVLGNVKGAGNSQEALSYEFTDSDARQPVMFYRLRQVDFDGSSHYSNVLEINQKALLPALQVQAYPNPAHESVNVRLITLEQKIYSLRLMDLTGRVLQQREIQSALDASVQSSFSLQQLAPGMYLLEASEVSSAGAVQTVKIVKQ